MADSNLPAQGARDLELEKVLALDKTCVEIWNEIKQEPILAGIRANVRGGNEILFTLSPVILRCISFRTLLQEVDEDPVYALCNLKTRRPGHGYESLAEEITWCSTTFAEPHRSRLILKWKKALEDIQVQLGLYHELARNDWFRKVASLLRMPRNRRKILIKMRENPVVSYGMIEIVTSKQGTSWSDVKIFLQFAFQMLDNALCPEVPDSDTFEPEDHSDAEGDDDDDDDDDGDDNPRPRKVRVIRPERVILRIGQH